MTPRNSSRFDQIAEMQYASELGKGQSSWLAGHRRVGDLQLRSEVTRPREAALAMPNPVALAPSVSVSQAGRGWVVEEAERHENLHDT